MRRATSGAGPWTAFRRVTLPLIVPALFSSALIAFTISFDEFAIASFLVPAGEATYPVYVYSGARTPALQPQILALGSVVVVASLLIVTAAEVFRTPRRAADDRLGLGGNGACEHVRVLGRPCEGDTLPGLERRRRPRRPCGG